MQDLIDIKIDLYPLLKNILQVKNKLKVKAINLWAKERTFVEIKQDVKISAPVFIRVRKFLIEKIIEYYEKTLFALVEQMSN